MKLDKLDIIVRNSYISVGIRKMALVTRLISGMPVVRAIDVLSLSHKACAKDILHLLHSGVKNAVNNFGVEDITNLYVKEIRLGRGRHMKRFEARARGRSNRIIKHSSNLVIILSEKR
jgi:large subunit ribosomal protein L22